MSDKTSIEWTDATWNPITGCSVVSPGCTNCYAMKLAGTRLQNHPSREGLTQKTKAGPVWTGDVRLNEEWLDQPLRWKRQRRIFVCAHGDLFHENVPDEWIDRVFDVMEGGGCQYVHGLWIRNQWHTFQVLTKRADRMRSYVTGRFAKKQEYADQFKLCPTPEMRDSPAARWASQAALPDFYRNIWLGVSVEDQQRADERIPLLLQTPTAIRFVSAEPLLGPVDLTFAECLNCLRFIRPILVNNDKDYGCPVCNCTMTYCSGIKTPGPFYKRGQLGWVIVGGESGPGARPMQPDWARSLRDQCVAAGVPYFFKQWGEWGFTEQMDGAAALLPNHAWRQDIGAWRAGKSLSGRRLDGREWNEFPEAA